MAQIGNVENLIFDSANTGGGTSGRRVNRVQWGPSNNPNTSPGIGPLTPNNPNTPATPGTTGPLTPPNAPPPPGIAPSIPNPIGNPNITPPSRFDRFRIGLQNVSDRVQRVEDALTDRGIALRDMLNRHTTTKGLVKKALVLGIGFGAGWGTRSVLYGVTGPMGFAGAAIAGGAAGGVSGGVKEWAKIAMEVSEMTPADRAAREQALAGRFLKLTDAERTRMRNTILKASVLGAIGGVTGFEAKAISDQLGLGDIISQQIKNGTDELGKTWNGATSWIGEHLPFHSNPEIPSTPDTGVGGGAAVTDTPTPTETPAPIETHSAPAPTGTPVPTNTPTASPTETHPPTSTSTATETQVPTKTLTPTATGTPAPTGTPTPDAAHHMPDPDDHWVRGVDPNSSTQYGNGVVQRPPDIYTPPHLDQHLNPAKFHVDDWSQHNVKAPDSFFHGADGGAAGKAEAIAKFMHEHADANGHHWNVDKDGLSWIVRPEDGPRGLWGIMDDNLEALNKMYPELNLTENDTLLLTKILCARNGVGVPEWGLPPSVVDHRAIQAGFKVILTPEDIKKFLELRQAAK